MPEPGCFCEVVLHSSLHSLPSDLPNLSFKFTHLHSTFTSHHFLSFRLREKLFTLFLSFICFLIRRSLIVYDLFCSRLGNLFLPAFEGNIRGWFVISILFFFFLNLFELIHWVDGEEARFFFSYLYVLTTSCIYRAAVLFFYLPCLSCDVLFCFVVNYSASWFCCDFLCFYVVFRAIFFFAIENNFSLLLSLRTLFTCFPG